jgi:DNA-binding transcriptional LysR family regulator
LATLLAHMNAEFQLRYPDVSLDVSISDDVVDLVEPALTWRCVPASRRTSLIGRMIGHCPRYMLASPDYLARRGR